MWHWNHAGHVQPKLRDDTRDISLCQCASTSQCGLRQVENIRCPAWNYVSIALGSYAALPMTVRLSRLHSPCQLLHCCSSACRLKPFSRVKWLTQIEEIREHSHSINWHPHHHDVYRQTLAWALCASGSLQVKFSSLDIHDISLEASSLLGSTLIPL